MEICNKSLILCIVIFLTVGNDLTVNARKRLPLKEEHKRRRHRNSTECYFGKKMYELEERWSPDLGPPFGVMFCIRCECLAISKKRRIVAKTRCRNIKTECPRPRCQEPTLLPGRCCKSCPGSDNNGIEDNIALSKSEMEASSRTQQKEYLALLTGHILKKGSLGTARAQLTFEKRNLHYTIYTNGLRELTSLRFLDEEDNIVKEQEITSNSSRICGIWRKLPRLYRRLLQKEKLNIVLVSTASAEGIVSGTVIKGYPFNSILFESVLAPNQGSIDSGGMASLAIDGATVLLSIQFNPGLLSDTNMSSVTIKVNIEKYGEDLDTRTVVITRTVTIEKISTDTIATGMKLDLDSELMKQMARGKLTVKITSQTNLKEIEGPIVPLQTCNVFQIVMSGSDSPEAVTPTTDGAGMALLDLNDEGAIAYNIQLLSLSSEVIHIFMQSLTRRLRTRRMDDFLPFYNLNGWANGTYVKTNSRDIDKMLKGKIIINVVTEFSEIRGKLKRLLHTEAHLYGKPILLTGNQTSAAAVAWLYIDDQCRLHYDVSASGMSRNDRWIGSSRQNIGVERHILDLIDLPQSGRPSPGEGNLKGRRIVLHKFNGIHINAIKSDLNSVALARLDSGVSKIRLTSKQYPLTSVKNNQKIDPVKVLEIEARISGVKVPSICLPSVNSVGTNINGGSILYHQQANSFREKDNEIAKTCYYEGKLMEEGTQWMAEHDKCMMCSCQKQRVVCDHVVCPALICSNQITLPGECCPNCRDQAVPNNSSDLNSSHFGCFFEKGDQRFHAAGTKWHPYLPPYGFSKCALCFCDPVTLKVKCSRITCEPLTCPEHKAYREHPRSCCKRCPVPRRNSVILKSGDRSSPNDESSSWTIGDILSQGGCKHKKKLYRNGDSWNPTVNPYGLMKNICCHCKDGKRRCSKKSCQSQITTNHDQKSTSELCSDGASSECRGLLNKGSTRQKQRRKS